MKYWNVYFIFQVDRYHLRWFFQGRRQSSHTRRRRVQTAFDGCIWQRSMSMYTNVEWVTSAPTFSHALMVIIAGRHALLSPQERVLKTAHTHAQAFEYHEEGTWCGRRRRRNVQRGAACWSAYNKTGSAIGRIDPSNPLNALGVRTCSKWYRATFLRTLINSNACKKISPKISILVIINIISPRFLKFISFLNNNNEKIFQRKFNLKLDLSLR